MTQRPEISPDGDEAVATPRPERMQGRVPALDSSDKLRMALEQAFNYRGEVTLNLRNGSAIEGYIFDRRADSARLEECTVRLMTKSSNEKVTIRYSDIVGLKFSGDDPASRKWGQSPLSPFSHEASASSEHLSSEKGKSGDCPHFKYLLLFLFLSLSAASSSWLLGQVKLVEIAGAPGTFNATTTVVFQSTGNIGYATNPGSGLLQKFRSTTGEVLASLQLSVGIGPAMLSRDQKTLLVLGVTAQKIYLVDTATLTLRKETSVPNSGFTAQNNFAMTSDGARILIADATRNQLVFLKGSDGSFDRALNVGMGPTQVFILPEEKQAVVLCAGKTSSDTDSIYSIDLFTSQVFDSVMLTGDSVEPFNNMQTTKNGTVLLVPLYADDRLAVYDLASGFRASRSSSGKGPTKILASPDGRYLAVVNSVSKEVALLNLPDALPSKTFTSPDLDFSTDSTIVFSSDSKSLYVPSLTKGEVIIYDIDSGTIKHQVRVSSRPTLLSLNTDTSMLASVDIGSNVVSLIALSPLSLYFPHLIQTETEFSGLALANFGSESANVTLTARSNTGGLLQGTTNPRILTIIPQRQSSMITSQIFGFKSTDTLEGWVEVQTLGTGVTGLYLAGTIDQTRLDGFPAITALGKLLGFSRITEQVSTFGGQTATELFVINPNASAAKVTFRLWGSTAQGPGQLLGSVERTVPAFNRFRSRVSALLPNVVYPLSKGYMEVISDLPVHGVEVIGMGDSTAIIPAKIRGLPDKLFYAAHFTTGGAGFLDTPIFTSVSFCNSAPFDITITAEVTDDNGKILPAGAAPLIRTLKPYETLSGTADEIFGFPNALSDPKLQVGTLKVTADKEGLLGDLLYGDAQNGKYLTWLALQPQPSTTFGFSHFAEGLFGDPPKGLFTGIALYNPNLDTVEITIDAYGPDGKLVGKSTQQLEGGKRFSKTIAQIIPSLTQQNGGSIRVSSKLPVLGFEVFGSSLSEFLAAVSSVTVP